MPARLCAHCGATVEDEDVYSFSRAKVLAAPIKDRGRLDPPGRTLPERTYVVDVVESVCPACYDDAQADAEARDHFQRVFISIIGILCALFFGSMMIPELRAGILAFIHPAE